MTDPALFQDDDDSMLFFDAEEEHHVEDIVASYEEEDDSENGGYGDKEERMEESDIDFKESIMIQYLRSIQGRLKEELSQKQGKSQTRRWLVNELKKNNWIIPQCRSEFICRELGLGYTELAYYRDVHVWLPEERWDNGSLPCCPNCKNADKVKTFSFPEWPGRRVFTLESCYYVMTRRYKCGACVETATLQSDRAQKPSQTFMGWNKHSLPRNNFGRGSYFPAYLTHRSGVDKSLLSLLRALIPRGIRPETTFSDILTEMHSKRYTLDMVEREYLLASLSRSQEGTRGALRQGCLLSSFADRKRYNGAIPTGQYFQTVFLDHHETTRTFLDNEQKKLPVDQLKIDTSYHVTKLVARYHGEKLFDGLLSVGSTLGHIRCQNFTHGEGHDQCVPMLRDFLKTQQAYGHPLPTHVSTDKPATDASMLCRELPSLQRRQGELDRITPSRDTETTPCPPIAVSNNCIPCRIEMADREKIIAISTNVEQINNFARSLQELLTEMRAGVASPCRIALGLDVECDTRRNPISGQICWSGASALLQIGYADSDGIIKAWLVQLSKLKELPSSLKNLLLDPNLVFVGVGIGGDIKNLEKKFKCSLADVKTCSLGVMARERGVVDSGTASLQNLVKYVLKQHLGKDPEIRCSTWSSAILSAKQQEYAALDVIKSLETYLNLDNLPNLAARLAPDEAVRNLQVDIFQSSGNISALTSVAAVGVVKSNSRGLQWRPPPGLGIRQQTMTVTQNQCLVTIDKVYASHLKVPNLTRSGDGDAVCVTLGDLARVLGSPFDVILPVRMLAKYLAKRTKNSSQHYLAQAHKGNSSREIDGTTATIPTGASEISTAKLPPQEPMIIPRVNPYRRKPAGPTPHPTAKTAIPTTGATPQPPIVPVVNLYGGKAQRPLLQPPPPANDEGLLPGDSSTNALPYFEVEEEAMQQREDFEEFDVTLAAEVDYSSLALSESDLHWIKVCLDATSSTSTMREVADAMKCSKLDEPPAEINDVYKVVTGDGYHFVNRPQVPMHHTMKKSFFFAFMEAWYAWDPAKFALVVEKLKEEGNSEKEVEELYFFNTAIFLGCCPRIVPPPSVLYWRVRAVFAFFGPMICPNTGKPLFNDRAWGKANNLLKEVLMGYGSDVPGESYYRFLLDSNGEIARNRIGLRMVQCCRGTSDVEASHRQLRVTYRNWEMGIELSDCLLSEFRHRYNHRISERRVAGFPKIGHFDTWLIDLCQNLVARNHRIRLYPTWSNATDFMPTNETFGVIPLHSEKLGIAIKLQAQRIRENEGRLKIPKKNRFEQTMTRSMKFICKRTAVELPFLPVHDPKECKLFSRLMRERNGNFDEEEMAHEWIQYCDGKVIHPKLPVYLRWYYKKWGRNEQIRSTINSPSFRSGAQFLKNLNQQSSASLAHPDVVLPAAVAMSIDCGTLGPGNDVLARSSDAVVGGTALSAVIASGNQRPREKRHRGNRGADKQQRRRRTCVRCTKANKLPMVAVLCCPGKRDESRCLYFNPDGSEKDDEVLHSNDDEPTSGFI